MVGMPPAARMIVQLLSGFGTKIIGYDPSLHANDGVWPLWQVAPVGLRDLVERADVLCVQLDYFSRYHGLLGDRFLRHSKPNQVVVSTAHSRLFDEVALATAMEARGLGAPGPRTWSRPSTFGRTDLVVLLSGVLVAGGSVAVGLAAGTYRLVFAS